MHERLHARQTIGIDRSESMLAGARTDKRPSPGLRFEVGTVEAFADRQLEPRDRPELIFSNAALHWVCDHAVMLPKLAGLLAPEGQLAFQVPAQHEDSTHVTAEELAASEPYKSALGGWRRAQPG